MSFPFSPVGGSARVCAKGEGDYGMKKRLLLGWVFLFFVGIGACCPAPVVSPTLAASVPALAVGETPSASSQASALGGATASLVPSPTPAPTPTLVPLPCMCLREPFATDVGNCGLISMYNIVLAVDPAAARVTGHQEIRYTNQESEPLSDLYLRLFPNSPTYGGAMTVTNVMLAGRALTPTVELEGAALRLPLVSPLAVGEALTVTMAFEVDVPTSGRTGHGLFSYQRGVMALPNVYPLIPVYDDEGWNVDQAPVHGDDVYSDIAAYDVRITAPSSMQLIASGGCTQQSSEGTETTWTCEAAPMRDFTLVLGEDFQQRNRMVEGVVVNSYFYAGHEAGGEKALQVAIDALSAFADLFGPYPYAELDVVETPNYLGGMEYPGLVVVEDGLYPGVVGVEWLTAHEVAHQWWFGLVGSDQVDEPWLDEALTQYSTMLYYERVYGAERAERIRYAEFEQVYQNLIRRGRNLPVGLSAREYPAELYWQVVYDKGALYFHALRERVGDEAFFDILRTYYQRHRYAIATPESFLATVESVTGNPHRDLFDEWVLGEAARP